MSTSFVVSVATSHDTTLIASATDFRKFDHYFFDHRSKSAFFLDDGRVPARITSIIIPLSEGLAILGRMSQELFVFTPERVLSRKERLQDFQGFPQGDIRLSKAVPIGSDRLGVTYSNERKDLLVLARIDLTKKSFEGLHTIPLDDDNTWSYWAPHGGDLHFVSSDSGQIDRLNWKTFRVMETIRQAGDLVKNPRWPYSVAKYYPRLSNALFLSDRVLWEYFVYDDKKDIIERSLYQLKDGVFEQVSPKVFPVGSAAGVTLVFDMDDGSYFLEDATTGERLPH